jgi:hypothetical protein
MADEQKQQSESQSEQQSESQSEQQSESQSEQQTQAIQTAAEFVWRIDYDVYHANGSKEAVTIEVTAKDEKEAFDLAARKLFEMRTDEDPIEWRYTQRFTKVAIA